MTMPLAVLEVPKEVAVAKLAAYRQAVRETNWAEDRALARGFKEIAAGRQLISLPETIAAGGFDDQQRPRLAIARADTRQVTLHRAAGFLYFMDQDWWRLRVGGQSVNDHYVQVLAEGVERNSADFSAIVPLVPPEHRPRRGRGLANLHLYHVLFEAEWRRVAPRDPALLRHLGGDMWVVLAVWDLTELERAVLAGRAR
jgi:hypothetical protein